MWHRIRRLSPAEALRTTVMLHAACGLAFLSDSPPELVRPKAQPICHQCRMADTALPDANGDEPSPVD